VTHGKMHQTPENPAKLRRGRSASKSLSKSPMSVHKNDMIKQIEELARPLFNNENNKHESVSPNRLSNKITDIKGFSTPNMDSKSRIDSDSTTVSKNNNELIEEKIEVMNPELPLSKIVSKRNIKNKYELIDT
jgi:hypothetical protein